LCENLADNPARRHLVSRIARFPYTTLFRSSGRGYYSAYYLIRIVQSPFVRNDIVWHANQVRICRSEFLPGIDITGKDKNFRILPQPAQRDYYSGEHQDDSDDMTNKLRTRIAWGRQHLRKRRFRCGSHTVI